MYITKVERHTITRALRDYVCDMCKVVIHKNTRYSKVVRGTYKWAFCDEDCKIGHKTLGKKAL